MQICKCNDSAALPHHFLPICTRFLYTTVQCAWGTLQNNRQINLIVSPNVWRPCKWFTFYCYIVISCIITTVRQFSTTSGPHWNVIYTLIKTAGVVHYRSAVRSRILSSVTECRRAYYLIFSADNMQICKCNDSAAFSHHFLPICTRFLYTTVQCAWGTLQTNRQITTNCLIKRMATVQVIHISLRCCHILHPNNCAAVLNHYWSTLKHQLYTDKDSRCGTL